jgi:hypothetical protein
MKQPNAREVMMMVGLKLLQGRKHGESLGQQFGAAIGTGVTASSMQKQNAVEGEDKLRKQGMEDEKHQVGMRRDTAQADKAEAENDFYSKTRAEAMEEIRLGIENLKTKGKFEQARLVEQEFQNGNLREAWELTKQDKRSAIWARNEQVKTGRLNAEKIPAAGQAKRDIEDLLKRANPQQAGESDAAYDQRIAQATLGIQQTSKTNSAADLLKLAEQTDDDDERAALLKEADSIIRGRQQGPATGRGGTASSGTKAYASEAAVAADFKAGKLKVGDIVLVNGKKLRVTP